MTTAERMAITLNVEEGVRENGGEERIMFA
jgi:hypothetical protein